MVKDPAANAGGLRDAGLIPGLGTERCPANRWRQRYQGEIRILCHMDFFFCQLTSPTCPALAGGFFTTEPLGFPDL